MPAGVDQREGNGRFRGCGRPEPVAARQAPLLEQCTCRRARKSRWRLLRAVSAGPAIFLSLCHVGFFFVPVLGRLRFRFGVWPAFCLRPELPAAVPPFPLLLARKPRRCSPRPGLSLCRALVAAEMLGARLLPPERGMPLCGNLGECWLRNPAEKRAKVLLLEPAGDFAPRLGDCQLQILFQQG